jgi:hypothetical protein
VVSLQGKHPVMFLRPVVLLLKQIYVYTRMCANIEVRVPNSPGASGLCKVCELKFIGNCVLMDSLFYLSDSLFLKNLCV